MGCCEAQYRKSQSFFFSRPEKSFFTFKDVVPIKHHHYLKDYDFEKNLPSTKERTSKNYRLKCGLEILLIKNKISGKRYVCKSICYYSPITEQAIMTEIDLLSKIVSQSVGSSKYTKNNRSFHSLKHCTYRQRVT